MPAMPHDSVQHVITEARRRAAWNEILAQLILALSICCGASIVLLLLGTQLLEWYWGALLAAIVAAITVWRLRNRLPDEYAAAQALDHKLNLHDTLSTAWYYRHHSERRADEAVAAQQYEMAADLSRTVDVPAAIPLTVPRSAYLLFALFTTTSILFAVRYGMQRELDIRAPLIQVFYDVFGGRLETRAAMQRKQPTDRNPWESETLSSTQAEEKRYQDEKQLDAAPDKVLDTIEVPDVDNDRTGTEEGKGKKAEGASPDGDPLEGEEGEGANAGREGESGEEGEAGQDGKSSENAANKNAPNNMNDNSSLAQKFRDALANLMSKMKQQTGQGQSKQAQSQQGGESKQAAQGSQKQQAQNQKGEQGGEGQEGEGQEQSEGQPSEGAKGKSSEQASSQTPGSGIGKQDGSKDVKAAEQLEAMGKISELLGKRAKDVTGEMTVEVEKSKAGIRTPYSPSAASHNQAGSEIRRDEVPPALQHYVQQYFERVRKQPAPAKSAPADPPQPAAVTNK